MKFLFGCIFGAGAYWFYRQYEKSQEHATIDPNARPTPSLHMLGAR